MTLTLALTVVPAVVLGAVCILVHRQIAALRQRLATTRNWTPELTLDRYRPMFRLLADDDIRFLRSQPGATPALVKRLRRQRYQVFRGYLRSLENDFHLAVETLLMVALDSQRERRDLLRALIVSRAKFSTGVLRVRCRLFLYRWNIGQEPLAQLVNLFEGLQLELLTLEPAPGYARV